VQYLQVNQLKSNDITFFKLNEKSNTVWIVDHYNQGYKHIRFLSTKMLVLGKKLRQQRKSL